MRLKASRAAPVRHATLENPAAHLCHDGTWLSRPLAEKENGWGHGLINLAGLRARIRHLLDFEFRPDFEFIRCAVKDSLGDRLACEDSESKTAVVLGDSLWLAGILGLRKTRLLHLPYPEFTIENLALLSDEYDFVIADRLLHRCDSMSDAACETVRVLRTGGWFVHTASILDFVLTSPLRRGVLTSQGLQALFSRAMQVSAQGGESSGIAGSGQAAHRRCWTAASWIIGQKPPNTPAVVPSVATRVAKPSVYRFRPRTTRFAVTAMARNEAPYLLEWIAYYRVLGFGQITIYDNCSNDASAKILRSLSKAGVINAVFWRDRPRKQAKAYQHAARRLRPFVEWCLFVDIDEFLVMDPGLKLDDLVPKDPSIAAVLICCRVFGSGGKRNREAGLTIERFTKAASQDSQIVKSLVRLRKVRKIRAHMPKGVAMADVDGRPTQGIRSNRILHTTSGRVRLNHYISRSWEEFECKRARGRGAVPGRFISQSKFDRGGPGEVDLDEILRWAPAVRQEVARLRKIVER